MVQKVQQVGGSVETREFLRAWLGLTSSLLTTGHTIFCATKPKLRIFVVIIGLEMRNLRGKCEKS